MSSDKKIKYAIKKSQQKQVNNCQNKKRYSSDVNAIAAALTCKDCNTDYDLYYYKCKMCNGFHLTRLSGGSAIFAA